MKSDAPVSRVGREALREAATRRVALFEGSDTAARSASLDTHARRGVPRCFGQQAREHDWQRNRMDGTTTPRGASWGCSERLTGFRVGGGCRGCYSRSSEPMARHPSAKRHAKRGGGRGLRRRATCSAARQQSGTRRAVHLDDFYPHYITNVLTVKRCARKL